MKSGEGRTFRVAKWLFLLAAALVMGIPAWITVSVSLQTMAEVYASRPVFIPAIPQWRNYITAMLNGNWPRYLFNSAYVTVVTVFISLLINSMAGYAFARIRFRGDKLVFALILVGLMIPPQVTMVPVFILLRSVPFAGGNDWTGSGGLGLLNTYAGLIAPYVAGSFGVFLMRQYFWSFPKALDDAALIDGCGRLRAFFTIYLPLSGPALASLGVIKFTGTWNEYTWPLVMTYSDEMKTVQIALTMFRDEAEIRWNELMAATLVSSAAIYLVFACTQKYFVSGLLAGSVKG